MAAGRYDHIGLFWEADVLCRAESPRALDEVDVLLLDGFDDFTPSEFRLLESLAGRVETLVIGLNCDRTDPEFGDLYAVQAATAEAVTTKLGAVVEHLPVEAPGDFTAFASNYLLYRRKPPQLNGLTPNLEILPCPGPAAEMETIGRRVKALMLVEGVSADDIAVVFRDLNAVAGMARSVFDEFGILLRIAHEPRISESGVGAFVLNVLEATEAWRRDDVVDVLVSPWFNPFGDPSHAFADEAALVARLAGVIGGFAEWERRLGAFLDRLDKGRDEQATKLVGRMPHARRATEALLGRVNALKALVDAIPSEAGLARFAEAVEALIGHCGIAGAVERCPVDAIRKAEMNALYALRNALGALHAWHEHDRPSEAMSRDGFLRLLRRALHETTFDRPQPEGGVLCMSVESGRHLRFKHVFFGGVNEGTVPQPFPASAIYPEEDILDLEKAGIVLEGKRARSDREFLLFHHVLNMAEERLVITWRTLTSDGKEAKPSPYLSDLLRLFPETAIEQTPRRASEFYPEPDQVASLRDLRNTAFATASPLRDVFGDRFGPVLEGVRFE